LSTGGLFVTAGNLQEDRLKGQQACDSLKNHPSRQQRRVRLGGDQLEVDRGDAAIWEPRALR
jgi:hypothetical protein